MTLDELADVGQAMQQGAKALTMLQYGRKVVLQLKTGFCWCGVGIGNPNLKEHSETCRAIDQWIQGIESFEP